jgi:Ca2+-binding RTX toxin-like protein
MTFDKIINEPSGKIVNGTSGRDFITAGDGDIVDAKGGDDCVVVNNATIVKAGEGKDVVVVKGSGNKVYGGNGNDKLYALAAGNNLLGEGDNDYLSGVSTTAVDGGAGTDECHTAPTGRQRNCESGSSSLLAQILSVLHL